MVPDDAQATAGNARGRTLQYRFTIASDPLHYSYTIVLMPLHRCQSEWDLLKTQPDTFGDLIIELTCGDFLSVLDSGTD